MFDSQLFLIIYCIYKILKYLTGLLVVSAAIQAKLVAIAVLGVEVVCSLPIFKVQLIPSTVSIMVVGAATRVKVLVAHLD